jgi:TRAP-type C4-dicarboxylate transport system permease small subunit
MAGRSSGMLAALTRHRRIGVLHGFSVFVRRMPPGDRAIAGVLACVFVFTCFVSLIALERTVLVAVPAKGGF